MPIEKGKTGQVPGPLKEDGTWEWVDPPKYLSSACLGGLRHGQKCVDHYGEGYCSCPCHQAAPSGSDPQDP